MTHQGGNDKHTDLSMGPPEAVAIQSTEAHKDDSLESTIPISAFAVSITLSRRFVEMSEITGEKQKPFPVGLVFFREITNDDNPQGIRMRSESLFLNH